MAIFGNVPSRIDVYHHYDELKITLPKDIQVKFPDAILIGSTPFKVDPIKVEISQVDDDAESQAAINKGAADLKQVNDDLTNAQK